MSEFIEVLSHNPWLFMLLAFVFAAVIGSFLNVVIHRLPVMMKREWLQECNYYLSEHKADIFNANKAALEQPIDNFPEKYNLAVPTSACPKCNTQIKAQHNLPIIGWLMLKGKCAACNTAISSRYPLVEFITALLITYLAYHFGPSWAFVWTTILTFSLVVLTGIDLDEMLLPDQITLPLLWLGLLINLGASFSSISDALLGAAIGYLSLWCVFWGFKLLTGKDGMGYGDFKLLAVFGAWFGWQVLPIVILLSSLVGAIVGISLILTKRHHQSKPIPFGPYIAVAGWIAMLWGSQITDWYLATL